MRNDLHDQAGTRRLAGAIVGAGGLALTAAGVYMLVAHSHRQDRPTTASIDIGTTGHGIVVFARF